MNSIREAAHDRQIDPMLKSLVSEAAANLRARHRGEATPEPELLPKHIYDGPKYDGKQCAVCQRHFKTAAEYVTCRLCKANICRRKGDCKSLHHAAHRLAAKKINHVPDSLVTPTTGLARSEHSRQDGERTPATCRDVLDQPNAEAVAKNDDTTRQEADRRGSQVCDCAQIPQQEEFSGSL